MKVTRQISCHVLGACPTFCTGLLDLTIDVVGVSVEAASGVPIVVEAVLAPAAAIDPAQNFVHVGLGLVGVDGDLHLLTHFMQVLKELRKEWTRMDVQGCAAEATLLGFHGVALGLVILLLLNM